MGDVGLTLRYSTEPQRRNPSAIMVGCAVGGGANGRVIIVPRILPPLLLQSDHSAAVIGCGVTGAKAKRCIACGSGDIEFEAGDRARPAAAVLEASVVGLDRSSMVDVGDGAPVIALAAMDKGQIVEGGRVLRFDPREFVVIGAGARIVTLRKIGGLRPKSTP